MKQDLYNIKKNQRRQGFLKLGDAAPMCNFAICNLTRNFDFEF